MTSTVVDVTVLLLCVSASVITLGIAGGGQGAGETGYTADDAADRLATETATITYPTPGAEDDSRTVHATLVEFLSMAIAAEEWDDTGAADRFRTRARTVVTDSLGPRTRVDVRHRFDRVETLAENADSPPVPTRSKTRTGAVRGGTENDEPTTVSTRDARAIGVGPEPPRDVEVTAAVVTHPVPERLESDEGRDDRLRVVVRVWY
ncbi:hypothetical protein J2751_002174 [Halorubrum alkaliphilum]|uniref:Uncharacterized protein n=1 Tax=Halorubrum alkaliphilum TaxID=261290 RepID=A0A8T4GG10_9EURY|nr:hypothetical protein [Halorubrum alkaliphilum]MBP1923136.1 hypothetical protein [Halorubrum alkaliphilum]